MKREFKKGDRVLVRNNDLEEWQLREFKRVNLTRPLYPFVVTDDKAWSQCRHIDEFLTGDKVQAQYDYGDEWHDAVYACALPQSNHWPHQVYNKAQTDTFAAKFVRWHPSMPWAEKEEPLTLEQRIAALEALQPKNEYRLEVLERKLNKQ